MLGTLLMVASMVALGADIVVSTDGSGSYSSIQRAVDAASYGDVILVNPGLYEESLVLISGITIRGSGESHTIIRSSYGYQPVVQGISVGSVVLQDLSLERGASILESTVVDLHSSQVVFLSCHISGGQAGGVHSSGVSTLSFQDCIIEDNLGYGLQVNGQSEVAIQGGRINANGSVGLYLRDAVASIDKTTLQWNEWDGIVLEGGSVLDGDAVTLRDNGRWGLRLLGSSRATLSNATCETQAFGNILLGDGAWLSLESCQLVGGMTNSVEAAGLSSLHLSDTEVTGAMGNGISLEENASLTLERTIVAHCADGGLTLHTTGVCSLQRATVAYNGGHGLEFRGETLHVTQSIFALNDGIGLTVAASGKTQDLQLDYNNVWKNRAGDYSGIHRSSSDLSEAPEFINPSMNDFSLSATSPCIGAGAFGTMIGASENPQRKGITRIEIGLAHAESEWGALEAGIALTPSSESSIDGHITWHYDWGFGTARLETSIADLTGFRTQGSVTLLAPQPVDFLNSLVSPNVGISGVWHDKASRWQAWGKAELVGDFAALRVAASYEGPSRITRQEFALTSPGFSLSGRAANLTLTQLALGWANAVVFAEVSSSLALHLQVVPDLFATGSAQWELGGGVIEFKASAYPAQFGTASFSLEWRDGSSTEATVDIRLRAGQFEDAEVGLRVRWSNIEVGGSLGANSIEGPRFKLGMLVDTSIWFLPRLNQPPVPAFSYTPLEPEAGELITFDASSSYDSDGELDQIWWDFGDGDSAIGAIVQHRFSASGEHTITVTVSDQDGDVTALESRIFVAQAQTTPTAAFTWAAVSEKGTRLQRALRAGDSILLDAMDSFDPNGNVVEYSWDIQSDGVFDRTTAEPRLVIDPLPAGTWPVTLRIVDNDGATDAIMRVLSIEELKPPIASFELSPATPAVGDPIRFVDTSIAVDGTLASWEWDFGNGHTSREREPSLRYEEAGLYDVTLTVRDSEGLVSTITTPVSVQLNPELVPIQQTWALVIGISNYEEVDDLSYARRDAEAIAAWLLGAGVPQDHIRLLTDDVGMASPQGTVDVDRRLATLVNVREGLGWLRQSAERDDLVLIHFSGHGYQGADDNLDERDGVDEFFVLYDTRAAAKDDTALRDDEFGRFLDRIESEHVLVFFDSCYSGGLSRSLTPGSRATGDTVDVFSDFDLEGRLILSASSENQDAFESPQLEHGVFTHFLLSGLAGEADLNGDGRITVWELFEYVRSEVPPFVQQERGEEQLPQLIGEGEARIVLTRATSARPVPFTYCPAIPFAGGDVWFRAEADANADSASLIWEFGDGGSAEGQSVVHRYDTPGVYVITLSVQGTDESSQMTVAIGDGARIIGADAESDQVLISVGRQHGILVGDRFSRSKAVLEGGATIEPPSLEVIELIDEDTAVCRILTSDEPPVVGNQLIPVVAPEKRPPCWETR